MPEKNNENKEHSIELQKESGSNQALEQIDSSENISDLMEGVAMGEISEKNSEKSNENGSQGKKQKRKRVIQKKLRPLPSSNVQKNHVLKEYQKEELALEKASKKLNNPYEFAENIKKRRSLRKKISQFVQYSVEKIKEIYLQYFHNKHQTESK
jgi:hypothetical protein